MKTLSIVALSMLLAVTSAFAAPTATAPASAVMPDVNHVWTLDEIVTAADLAATRTPLLTYATPEGKAFFERLRATDYFTELVDSKVPLKTRISQCAAMFTANGRLLKTYAHASDRGEAGPAELSRLLGLQLNYASMYAILSKQALASANPKDPKVAAVKSNLDAGFSVTTMMALKVIQAPHYLPPADLTYELRTVASSVKSMNEFFTPATRAALSRQLTSQRAQLTTPGDQQLADQIMQILAQ